MNRIILAGMIVVSMMGLAVSAETPAKTKADVQKKELVPQKTCPVMGSPISKTQYVDVKGSRVYICCPGCIDPIKKDPDKYIKILNDRGESVEKAPGVSGKSAAKTESAAPTTTSAPATATAGAALVAQKSCPLTSEAIDKKVFVDYNGKRIYACCDGCLTALKKDPEKAIKDLAAKGESVESIVK